MPNLGALSLLKEYDDLKLDKKLFRDKLHHLSDSFESFRQYSASVRSFKRHECNQLLLDRLKFILGQVRSGAPADRSGLEMLIEKSWIEIPCSHYANCKGHRFDPRCKHRK